MHILALMSTVALLLPINIYCISCLYFAVY